jgi:solute carrier family 12 sodium/potassium/chloride transporter 2
MAALLSKFRIEYCDVIVIPDISKKAQETTKREFEALIKPFKVSDGDSNAADGTSIF